MNPMLMGMLAGFAVMAVLALCGMASIMIYVAATREITPL